MKTRFLLVLAIMLLPFTQLAAQNWVLDLKKAVDQLHAPFNRKIQVRIQPITISGTDTPTAFSRYLLEKISNFATNTSFFSVDNGRSVTRAANRPQAAAATGTITGSYTILSNSVEVILKLISDADNIVLSSDTFTVTIAELEAAGIAFLPPDAATVADVQKKEAVLMDIPTTQVIAAQTAQGQAAVAAATAPAAPVPTIVTAPAAAAAAKQKLTLSAWPSSDSRVYYDGDKLSFSIFADKDCYVMVYHIDTNQKIQLIFPNTHDRDNFIKGGTTITIPQNSSYFFNLEAPFGQDTILVKGSLKQFDNVEAEMQAPEVVATRAAVSSAVGRGLSIRANSVASVAANSNEPDAAIRFTYTVIPSAENQETISFSKPEDSSAFFRELRAGINAQGGQLTGNEQQGSFSAPGISGTYRIEGSDLIFTLRELRSANTAARTRGVIPPKGYSFTFARPRDIRQAVNTVQSSILQKGGSFSFSKIISEYTIAEQVTVLVIDKPAMIPNSLIESQVKQSVRESMHSLMVLTQFLSL